MKVSEGKIGAFEMLHYTLIARNDLLKLFEIGKEARTCEDERSDAFDYVAMIDLRGTIGNLNSIIKTLKMANGGKIHPKDNYVPELNSRDYFNHSDEAESKEEENDYCKNK